MASHSDVLCAGIIVADHTCTPVDHLPRPGELVLADRLLLTIGGCAANVAVDLAKMGVPSSILGRVGDDFFGHALADMLREYTLDVTGVQFTLGIDTSQTLIVNVLGQDRRFIHCFGANSVFRAADIPLSRVNRCRVLYLGGYLLMPGMLQEDLVPVFQAARQAGARTVLDVVTPGPARYLERLERLLPYVDVFLPNNHEAELITGESDPLRQALLFHQLGVSTSIITMGGNGVVLVSDRLRLKTGIFPVPFVDGCGGGDAFDAGYVYGLLNGLEPMDCLRIASALGASCVQAVGATTGVFTRAQCEEFLRHHTLPIETL